MQNDVIDYSKNGEEESIIMHNHVSDQSQFCLTKVHGPLLSPVMGASPFVAETSKYSKQNIHYTWCCKFPINKSNPNIHGDPF